MVIIYSDSMDSTSDEPSDYVQPEPRITSPPVGTADTRTYNSGSVTETQSSADMPGTVPTHYDRRANGQTDERRTEIPPQQRPGSTFNSVEDFSAEPPKNDTRRTPNQSTDSLRGMFSQLNNPDSGHSDEDNNYD